MDKTSELKPMIPCDTCDAKFTSFRDFEAHVAIMTRIAPHLICISCRKRFAPPFNLSRLVKMDDCPVTTVDKIPFMCKRCKQIRQIVLKKKLKKKN